MLIKNLDYKVRALRAVCGMSVAEFCAEVGITPKTIWRWERGEPIAEPVARRMATAFGYTFDQFLSPWFPANNTEALLCMQQRTIKRVLRVAKRARS